MAMRLVVLVLVLAPVSGGEEPLPEIRLAEVAAEGTVALPAAPLTICIDRCGQVRSGDRIVTLDELGGLLAKGDAGRDVVLRSDVEIPWIHLQWLLTVLAEHRYARTHLAVKVGDAERVVEAFLPADQGVAASRTEPRNEIVVSVHIVSRKERPAEFGPPGGTKQVLAPFEVRYRYGDRETADPEGVGRWLGDATRAVAGAENAVVVGEIRAGAKVPWRFVAEVLRRIKAHLQGDVRFLGAPVPGEEIRQARSLPYPKVNYPTGGGFSLEDPNGEATPAGEGR